MASRWFYRVFDQEMGPVAFQDLAELVRAGTLTEEDRVRREFSDDWIPAREVIGLFRASQGQAVASESPERESVTSAPEPRLHASEVAVAAPRARRRWRIPRIGLRVWLVAALLLLVAAIVGYEIWSHRSSRVFPESALKKPRRAEKLALESLRAARPKEPSVPGLKEGVPVPIPGLEQIQPAYTPTLTRDLKTIVFAWYRDWRTGYDLYEATRDDVAKPFSAPRRIESTVSRKTEAFASLSPDGLDLAFLRGDGPQQMFRCARDTRTSEFGPPIRVATPGWDAPKRHIEATQFLDSQHLAYCGTDYEATVRSWFVLTRADRKSPFGAPEKMSFPTTLPPPYFFAESGLRAYFTVPDALYVSSRNSPQELFGGGPKLLDADKGGPFQGPIWVTAEEDVLFYCSPGRGKKVDSARKLWMVRF